jgi:hypothetical protein
MSTASSHQHRVPRAGIDPIRSHEVAIDVIGMAIHQPLRPETIMLLLDHRHCGSTVAVVNDTAGDDDVLDVVERITAAATRDASIGAVVVASVRPGQVAAGVGDADIDRWLELSDIVEECEAELLEWYVITPDAVTCPRDLLGEPPRWRRAGGARWG